MPRRRSPFLWSRCWGPGPSLKALHVIDQGGVGNAPAAPNLYGVELALRYELEDSGTSDVEDVGGRLGTVEQLLGG